MPDLLIELLSEEIPARMQAPAAEVDALGRAIAEARLAALGAAAAFHRRDLGAGDRGAGGGVVRGRWDRGRRRDAGAPLPRASAVQGEAARRLRAEARTGQGR